MWKPGEELKARAEAGEGMIASIRPRACGVVLIEGEGMPTKVGVGAQDLPIETWLDITNRFLEPGQNPYTQVSRVHSGMILLHVDGLQKDDHASCSQQGLTVRTGHGEPPAHGGERVAMETDPEEPTFVWRVVGTHGRVALLVLDQPFDSMQVATILQDHMTGRFHVERLDTASVTAAPSLVVPGWLLNVGPAHEPEPLPNPGFGG